jgi:hypothetical protein
VRFEGGVVGGEGERESGKGGDEKKEKGDKNNMQLQIKKQQHA